MPTRPARVCAHSGCPNLVTGSPRCPAHTTAPTRGSSTKQGYGSPWRKAVAAYLAKHKWCVYCAKQGKETRSTCVDHIIPHKGDKKLFWDVAGNWAASCKACNSAKCAREEGGFGNPRKATTVRTEPPKPVAVPAEGYWLI